MKNIRLIVVFLCAVAISAAQCPTGTTFPGTQDTDASLTLAVNNLSTNLAATLSPSSTSMVVVSTAGWQPYMMATVDIGANQEIVFVTAVISGTVLQISHPCEGTIASTHLTGAPAVNNVTAYSGSTGPKSAIYAMENFILNGGLSGVINSGSQYQVPYYSTNPTGTVVSGDPGFTYNQPSALLTATNASFGALAVNTLTGSTQCLQVDSSGNVSGTGAVCGTGSGGGTVNAAPQFQVASYVNAGTSAVVGGTSGFTFQSGVLTVPTRVTAPAMTISGITGSTQCLTVNTSGVVSGTGASCGSTNSGTQFQVAFYATSGTTLSGNANLTFNNSTNRLTALNLTISGLSGTQCLQETSGAVSGSGGPCGIISAEAQYDVPFYSSAGTGTTLGGTSAFNYNLVSNTLSVPNGNFGIALTANNLSVTNGIVIGAGAHQLFRCVTAGAARAGTITAVAADCGTSAAVGINAP